MLGEVSPSAGENVSIRHSSQCHLGQEDLTAQVEPAAKSLQVLPKKKVRTFTIFDTASKVGGRECS